MTDLNDKYCTSYEAAETLGLRYDTFRKKHQRGALKFKPVGNFGTHMIWRREEVEHHRRQMEA